MNDKCASANVLAHVSFTLDIPGEEYLAREDGAFDPAGERTLARLLHEVRDA